MKIRSLGRLLVITLLVIAAGFAIVISLIISKYDATLKNVNDTYLETALPLRQIDANTKNLRFHLLASFMHDPALEVSKYHKHPTAMHTTAIKAVIEDNKKLWTRIDISHSANPEAKDIAELKGLYDEYFRKGMGPGIAAATDEKWNDIIASVTATLPDYVKFEKALQIKGLCCTNARVTPELRLG